MPINNEELERRFNFHPPSSEEVANRHQKVRLVCRDAAREIVELTGPPSREQSLAITALEEAMFWANGAIARPKSLE